MNIPQPRTREDYINLSNDIICSSIEYIGLDGWSHYDTVDGLEIEEKPIENSDIACVKTTCSIYLGSNSLVDLLRLLFNPSEEERKYMFNELITYNKHEIISNKIFVIHSEYSASSITSNREFLVMKSYDELEEGGYVICTKSIHIDDVQLPSFSSSNVEGYVYGCTVLELDEDDPSKIIMTAINHIEPNGWIPNSIVSTFKSSSTEWISRLQQLLLQ